MPMPRDAVPAEDMPETPDARACGEGETECAGRCVRLDLDPANCGACGNVCAPGTTCVGGVCECPGGLTLCDGECVNTQSDDANCGGCGITCASPDPRCAASSVCLAGTCADTCTPLCPCPTGCADFDNDPNNCGGCGVVVPSTFICSGGAPVCPPGTRQCGDVCVALNDPRHCGGCEMVCTGACVFDVVAGTATCETCDGGPCGFDSGVP